MDEKNLIVWLSKLDFSNKIKLEILKKFKNIENIWKANYDDFIYYNISDLVIDKIMNLKIRNQIQNDIKYMETNNINVISFYDKKFPKRLLEIQDFPLQLYYIGNINLLYQNNVAIVGSRNASEYGRYVSKFIAKELSKKNINVVSGLANGIDKYAHLGSLEINYGRTIAVLGTGVDEKSLYPLENKKVYERIIENSGIIISEYPIGSMPLKHHFPARNRIISGISDKIVVVEAGNKSGSLITVDFALEQGKDVWAVPGNIFSKNSEGTNKLISDGAFLFSKIEDIL